MRNVSDKSCKGSQNTYSVLKTGFLKITSFMRDNMKKIMQSWTGCTNELHLDT